MEQVYFLHTIFRASPEEISTFIEDYLELEGKWVGKTNFRLQIYERQGFEFTWWYAPNSQTPDRENEPFKSNIDIVELYPDRSDKTEVRIVFSNHLLLFLYFAKLAFSFFDRFQTDNRGLSLPKLADKPEFNSPAEYVIDSHRSFQELLNLWPETEKNEREGSVFTDQQEPADLKIDLFGLRRVQKYFEEMDRAVVNDVSGVNQQEDNQNKVILDKTKNLKPWEKIKNKGWNRTALQMWFEQKTAKEISKEVGVSARRVTNLLSELRQFYGKEIVPYHRKR